MDWFEIIVGGIVEGVVITVSYVIIEYVRKRRITTGYHCPFCNSNIKDEVKKDKKMCDFCKRKLSFDGKNTFDNIKYYIIIRIKSENYGLV